MRYSKLFGKTLREVPADAEAVSHKLLVKGGFIDKVAAGIYSFLPLGFRVHRKIENILREEMNAIGGQEVFLPAMQPKALWEETDRWDYMDPPLFQFKDQHGRKLALGSTHEEVITDLARRFVQSYKDLPLYLYQIQNKFRNEMRSTGGLLRVREFVMKDLYSFHESEKDVAAYFREVINAYHKIFARCELDAIASVASGGAIGGTTTYEFQVVSKTGEDKIIYCPACGFAVNKEAAKVKRGKCGKCGKGKLLEAQTIEVGHVFDLGTEYSKKMEAYFTDKDGKKKLIWMGCYGIGVGRLMATIVEAHHDKRGIIWPKAVAPFHVHLTGFDQSLAKVKRGAEELYTLLEKSGIEVLYDDREESAGVKFNDADLIGIPVRLVASKESIRKGGVEFKRRDSEKVEIVPVEKLAGRIRKVYQS